MMTMPMPMSEISIARRRKFDWILLVYKMQRPLIEQHGTQHHDLWLGERAMIPLGKI
jgi:hypothetical protein